MLKAKKKTKTKSLGQLKKEADRLFSLAVRYRDGEEVGGVYWANCITCGFRAPIKTMHAGHFISRRFGATRYSELNVHAQCVTCNTFHEGEQYKYGKEIDLRYGVGVAEQLFKEAHGEFKYTRDFLEEIIHDSKEQVKFYTSGIIK